MGQLQITNSRLAKKQATAHRVIGDLLACVGKTVVKSLVFFARKQRTLSSLQDSELIKDIQLLHAKEAILQGPFDGIGDEDFPWATPPCLMKLFPRLTFAGLERKPTATIRDLEGREAHMKP